ncbi:MAG: hypothetical protein KDB11_28830 [Planctomycetales bacterium]|nr:hypothetical protein [Planctomycetales bacterium]
MKSILILLTSLLSLLHSQLARADFVGPSVARHALSPNGELLVRIKTPKRDEGSKAPPKHEVSYYEFDATKDSYIQRSSFELTGYLAQMLYVSNAGDLVLVALGEKEAVRLYSKDGKLALSWDLNAFLTKDEVKACAQTGSTLQWFDEGAFYNRVFYLRGPSRLIRALSPPYTVMRGADDKVTFSAAIDTENAKLKKHEPEEP